MTTQRPLTIADMLEVMADAVAERPFVKLIDGELTYADIDKRANRFAHHLLSLGVQPGEHVAIHAHNCVPWIDAFFGTLKVRAVPININYKYLTEELAYLYDNSDAVVAVVGADYEDLARGAITDRVREVIVLDSGYDALMAAQPDSRPEVERSADDHYVIYTGGTTGSPKGVVWRNEDIIKAALNAARYGAAIESVEQLGVEAANNENPMTLMAAGPLMHGGSQWIMGNALTSGQSIAFYTEMNFDALKVLDLTEKAKVVSLAMLGDAMARPLAEAVLANPDRWDLSGLMALSNGAAPLSRAVREELLQAFPGRFILDTYGASESGAAGSNLDDGSSDGKARFGVGDDVQVFDFEWKPAAVGVHGMLARSGAIPLGYYKDETKTAATFREIDGVRWVIPGDAAVREEDGTIIVLGRGSVTINTGGEKVHPEEVEGVLLRHPDVFDAAVIGTPHDRWGQQVTAVVQKREGSDVTAEQIIEHVKGHLANYKAPKEVLFVDKVPRTAVSKVDYRAAADLAIERTS
jgi:acyl-CoA synthetase (AMP-forming)/AMP-acid ligase II